MQSPGPPYQGPSVVSTDLYANRNYENHVLSSHGVSASYLTYHSSDGSHESPNYCEQSHYSAGSAAPPHETQPSPHHNYNSAANSGHTYGQPVNQFNDMYTSCSPYAAIPPAIRPPIPSSTLKYWNSDQMSHNSHNYTTNQGIPPPPLVSRTAPALRSPTDRTAHCTTGNAYTAGPPVQHRSASQSPQDWSRSPGAMRSPSTTPSPLPSHSAHNNRSPSHQFSPSHSSPSVATDSSSQPTLHAKTDAAFSNHNHTASQANASNPLQSLQKMVMIDSEGQDVRHSYDNMAATPLQSNGSVHKHYNSDQTLSADPDSPYPTYYNLDQNRLCTPPRPSPAANANLSYDNIPNATPSGGQLCGSDKELNKCDKNDNKCNNGAVESNSNNDLIFVGGSDSKETVQQMSAKANDAPNSGGLVNGEKVELKKEITLAKNECSVMDEQPALCKRTSSQESLQSSDSEKAHSTYGENRALHNHNWQMESHYYNNNHSDKPWTQWPPTSGPHSVPPNSDYMPGGGRHVLPNPNTVPDYSAYQSPMDSKQCGSGSWSASASTSQSSSSQRNFASPKHMNAGGGQNSGHKKRGRPFGSKNRRNSDDTNSETNASDSANSTKKKKKAVSTEIGINTSVTLDAHGFDELAVVNPLKQTSKRKKTVGPFIRLEKGKGKGSTVYSIVNTAAKPEDEKDTKNKSFANKLEPIKPLRRPSLLVSSKKVMSTFSPQYDYNNRDKTWVCALCHRGPHYKGLGDLYGPYYISSDDKSKPQTTTSAPAVASTSQPQAKGSRSDSVDEVIDLVVANDPLPPIEEPKKRGRRRKSETTEETTSSSSSRGRPKNTSKTVSSSQNNETEVWVHEDCIVWSSGVYLIGHRVRHLEEVISESSESFCTKCKLSGATLGCLQKSCNTSQFHYLCAKEKGCELDDENFSLLCPKHKKKGKTNSDEPSAALT
ncbi:unnamed protein product [Oppiella nova]|uniref:PHD-type domain-containing protein n=1 Tax=Oppiella nova TaxID=334625 RepID=A0A7R9QPH5_9ACAR|nr:unnamed protein product [Oppiella nova]CAG2169569.1 unnamed protein product [Oppiella nova]